MSIRSLKIGKSKFNQFSNYIYLQLEYIGFNVYSKCGLDTQRTLGILCSKTYLVIIDLSNVKLM